MFLGILPELYTCSIGVPPTSSKRMYMGLLLDISYHSYQFLEFPEVFFLNSDDASLNFLGVLFSNENSQMFLKFIQDFF